MVNKTTQATKFKRIKIPIEVKKEIIEKRERGVSVVELAREYNRNTSTICCILKNREQLKASTVSRGVSRHSRSKLIDDVERLLLIWIDGRQRKGEQLTQSIICEKAKRIYGDIVAGGAGQASTATGTANETFKASNGWLERFKERTGIHSIFRQGKTSRAANDFVAAFNKLVRTEGFLPQQIFHCVETGLFCRQGASGTVQQAAEQKCTPSAPVQGRLTLLLCANASGDLKIKPLLVSHTSSNGPPRAFQSNSAHPNPLDVLWRADKQALVSGDMFAEWISGAFMPSVTNYLQESKLPLRALLVVDSAYGRCVETLADNLSRAVPLLKVQVLPPNTAPVLQPMDQRVIRLFKKHYLKQLLVHCLDVTHGTHLSVEEFWALHFHIGTCAKLIGKAWAAVTAGTLSTGWKRLLPGTQCSTITPHTGSTREPTMDQLCTLASCLGMEIGSIDIDGLVAEHDEADPSTEQLQKMLKAEGSKKMAAAAETQISPPQSIEDIQAVLNAWDSIAPYVRKHHPDVALAARANDAYESDVIAHYRAINVNNLRRWTVAFCCSCSSCSNYLVQE
uniref:HTH CENPB-type domain-containing protein n=1 Tax=Anopheles merus TaxID=30066 RepID=A0A182UPG1_ANOME